MVNGGAATGASLLITFDDGYLDNYTLAYPVLRSHGVQGTFFLPTSFVATTRLPWWDEIAYIVKTSRHRQIRLAYPQPAVFDLDAGGAVRVCMDVLRLFRQPVVTDTGRFMAGLEEACGTSRPQGHTERRFLNWDEAREMQAHGMAFGSHTHNHEVLSKLPLGCAGGRSPPLSPDPRKGVGAHHRRHGVSRGPAGMHYPGHRDSFEAHRLSSRVLVLWWSEPIWPDTALRHPTLRHGRPEPFPAALADRLGGGDRKPLVLNRA